VAASFIGGGNRSTQRKTLTQNIKLLDNFIDKILLKKERKKKT
jgi:hypothetical protein